MTLLRPGNHSVPAAARNAGLHACSTTDGEPSRRRFVVAGPGDGNDTDVTPIGDPDEDDWEGDEDEDDDEGDDDEDEEPMQLHEASSVSSAREPARTG